MDKRTGRANEPHDQGPAPAEAGDATVKRYHDDSHDQLRTHLHLFVNAYNYARRLKMLRGLTPCAFICNAWTKEPDRFRIDPSYIIPGPYSATVSHCPSPPSLRASIRRRSAATSKDCRGRRPSRPAHLGDEHHRGLPSTHLFMLGGRPNNAFLMSAAHGIEERFGIGHTTLQVETSADTVLRSLRRSTSSEGGNRKVGLQPG